MVVSPVVLYNLAEIVIYILLLKRSPEHRVWKVIGFCGGRRILRQIHWQNSCAPRSWVAERAVVEPLLGTSLDIDRRLHERLGLVTLPQRRLAIIR